MNTIGRLDQLYTQFTESAGIASDEQVGAKMRQSAALAGDISHNLKATEKR
jgi:hypothetical protein